MNHHFVQLSTEAKRQLPTVTIAKPRMNIALSDREQTLLGDTASAGGFARDSSGSVTTFSGLEEMTNYARRNGYAADAVESAHAMSTRTGGTVRFAQKSDASSIADILTNIKQKLNSGSENLDLVFAIDYSGSMSDDIKAVIEGLTVVSNELSTITASGRNVRVGIALFGEEGRERIALPLTSNLVTVAKTLSQLLAEFEANQISDRVGEASFHGLEKIADGMQFGSSTPMIILITDEAAKEILDGRTQYVKNVWSKLDSRGIKTSIFTIVTKQ